MPVRSRKWVWITLVLTLVLGVSLGILLDRFVLTDGGRDAERTRDNGSRGERFKAHLESELNLSPEQKDNLERVLATNREKAETFWGKTRTAYAELRKQFRQEIRALLTPEQQRRYDEMLAAEDAKRKKRNRDPGSSH